MPANALGVTERPVYSERTERTSAGAERDKAKYKQNNSPLKVLLTIEEFMMNYGFGRTTTYEFLNSGRLEAIKLGRSTRIKRESADALVASLPAYRVTRAA
ncbi:DNA-binding protein [Methylobacterium nonmethylotrophicum]|uniref:DNA-binding protein n=2 Tax=Methylobacterium nonmethylotrophicum TaxID=1141884 RepID=A0A4Z0NDC1_9HYPH|nr:helix-turn-helix domain-containing protein [Methylobacterium nonmethylotrophicum]TGD92630.1 DNA-binding protein [Methylobacterium nonmethylotrophicum]